MKKRFPFMFLSAVLLALAAPVADAEVAGENVIEARPVLARSSLRGGAAPVIAAEGGPVIEDGGRGTPAVFSLDTAGNRTGAVPSRFEDGVLRFRVCTHGPDGGRIYYEITRQP